MIAAFIGALALQAAAPADPGAVAAAPAAASTTVAPATVTAKPKDDSQKVICKEEVIVGSMIPRRLCGTKADWDARTQDAQDATKQIQSRALARPTRDQALTN